MLFVTEIANAAKRNVAHDYIQSHEGWAVIFAAQCVPGAVVKLGPVQKRPSGATFEVRVAGEGVLVPFTVTIARGMPESDVWSVWALALEVAGLRVKADATYAAACFAALERHEA